MLTRVPEIISSTEFRANMAKTLSKAKAFPVVITTAKGSDSFVVLGKKLYNDLVEKQQDSMDSQKLLELVKKYNDSQDVPLESLL